MSARRPRVVVLDDDPKFIDLMAALLPEEGFRYVARGNRPIEADAILRLHPDLIILDLRGVEGVHGLEHLEMLRADPLLADLPVLICSGDIQLVRDHAAKLSRLPHVGVLEKPFRIETLSGALNQLLAGSTLFPAEGRDPDPAAVVALEERLGRIARSLRWAVVDAWVPDRRAGLLHCAAAWAASVRLEPFAQVSRRTRLPVGMGLPGRVWASRRAAWVEDLPADLNFPRRAPARRVGLVSAAVVPVMSGGDEVIGVVAGYDTRLRPPDPASLDRLRRAADELATLLRAAAGNEPAEG